MTYYDEVALEGIRLAHDDVARLAVQGKRLETLQHAAMALVERLDRVESPLPRGGVVRTEAKAAVEAAGPDRAGALVVQRPQDLKPEWRVARPVVCISGNDPLDATVAAMLAQVLTRHGLTAETAAWADLAKNPPSTTDASDVRLVCLSFLEPLSTVHLRMMVRQVHRIAPKAHVFVGIWRQRDPAMVAQLATRLHTDALVTTFSAALVEAQKLAAK